MRILGIHDGHNAAAAVVIDGRVVAAVQEERFTREKNWSGFPRRSIAWALCEAGLGPRDIDAVALANLHMPAPKNRAQLLEEYRTAASLAMRARRLARHTPLRDLYARGRRAERLAQIEAARLPADRVHFVEHHTAHAAAAYYGWGRHDEPVLVLTNDGAGDGLCASVNVGGGGRMLRLTAVPDAESLGNIYAVVTFLMGMVPLEHEYKLMGMAPYAPNAGRDAVLAGLRPLMRFVDRGVRWRRAPGVPETYYSLSLLRETLALRRFDWICAGLQAWVEEMLVAWVRNCIRATGIRKVALGGGVFMNVKANKAIADLPEVEDLFVFPSCGDETNAVGAAYWVEAGDGVDGSHIPPLRDVYWGPAANEAHIAETLCRRSADGRWTYEKCADIAERVAALLAAGEIVARCSGPAEFGARALGNRSILADASRPEVVRVINDMIKSRDFWMPFAPAVLAERAHDYLVNPKGLFAPYMILSFDTTAAVDDLRAAIHPYDRTARPEVVRQDWNPEFYRVLKAFERRTGRGAILNTSFNLHGYPIVNSPDDALDVLEASGLRHLALDDFLVSKRA